MDDKEKICKGCFQNKSLDKFSLNSSKINPLRLRSRCKDCESAYRLTDTAKNNLRKRNDKLKTDPEYRVRQRFWEEKYRASGKARVAKRKRHYERYNSDINYRLSCVLRSRLSEAVRNKRKAGSAVQDLGCSMEYFINHIQLLFSPLMSWDNYGEIWEIDHIIPLHSFDLTDPEQIKKACHYSNLRPLTLSENRARSY